MANNKETLGSAIKTLKANANKDKKPYTHEKYFGKKDAKIEDSKAYKKINKILTEEPFKADKLVQEVNNLVKKNSYGQEHKQGFKKLTGNKILNAAYEVAVANGKIEPDSKGTSGAEILKQKAKEERPKTIAGKMKKRFQNSAVGKAFNSKNAISRDKAKSQSQNQVG